MAKNGLHLITPTSIAYTGTSASISANGSVTFSAVSTLSLNGVFSADYDNYTIVCWLNGSTSAVGISGRYRSSGTDATGSNYTWQYLLADSTSTGAGRASSDSSFRLGPRVVSTPTNGWIAALYGPYLAQPTATRSIGVCSESGAFLQDSSSTHSLSTSYDGFTAFPSGGTMTGRVAVYGMRK